MEKTKGCKPFDQETYLKAIEEDPKFKQFLIDNGISINEDGMSLIMTYYDFLTREEMDILKETIFYKKFNENPKSRLYAKLLGTEEGGLICDTPNMCDDCRKHLSAYRKRVKEDGNGDNGFSDL